MLLLTLLYRFSFIKKDETLDNGITVDSMTIPESIYREIFHSESNFL